MNPFLLYIKYFKCVCIFINNSWECFLKKNKRKNIIKTRFKFCLIFFFFCICHSINENTLDFIHTKNVISLRWRGRFFFLFWFEVVNITPKTDKSEVLEIFILYFLFGWTIEYKVVVGEVRLVHHTYTKGDFFFYILYINTENVKLWNCYVYKERSTYIKYTKK